MAKAAPRTYRLDLTERELYFLINDFEASFTDPDTMNKHERSAQRKLTTLFLRSRADIKATELLKD